MAREEIITLVDDLDGTAADETVEFGLDGWAYEIDLNSENAKVLRSALVDFVGSARRVGKVKTGNVTPIRRGGPARVDREQTRAIREWASANGFEVSARGRIPAKVVEAYHQSA